MKVGDQLHGQWTIGKTGFDTMVMRVGSIPAENSSPVAQPVVDFAIIPLVLTMPQHVF
jgi:hypothetical protein